MGTLFLVAIVLFAMAMVFRTRKAADVYWEGPVLVLALLFEFLVIVPKVGW